MPIETARLLLRPPRLTDAPPLFEFLGDARATQYTTPRASLRDCRRYLAAHERQRRRVGSAPWIVIEKETGTAIGFGGLYEDPFDPGWGVEVGYFLAPAAWGKGYATELTLFCVALARQPARWQALRAFAHPQNTASQKVLFEIGIPAGALRACYAKVLVSPRPARRLMPLRCGRWEWRSEAG